MNNFTCTIHAEHTRNEFYRTLSIRGAESNTIFKNLVLQALGTIRIRFLQKKVKKKFHACVPLSMHQHILALLLAKAEVFSPKIKTEKKI